MNSAYPLQPSNSPLALPQAPFLGTEKSDSDFDAKQLLAVARRHALVVTGVAAGVMAFSKNSALNQEATYSGRFKLLIEPLNADQDVTNIADTLENEPTRSSQLDYASQIQVLKSPDLIEKILTEIRKVDPDVTYQQLVNNLTIVHLNGTKIIEVRYSGADATSVQVALDEIAEVYLNYSLDERQTNFRQGMQFIDQQLPEIQDGLRLCKPSLKTFVRPIILSIHRFRQPRSQGRSNSCAAYSSLSSKN